MFKLTNVECESNRKTRKKPLNGEILKALTTISSGDSKCVRIDYPEGHYANAYNCTKSFKDAITRYGFNGKLHCFTRDGATYIRKLV